MVDRQLLEFYNREIFCREHATNSYDNEELVVALVGSGATRLDF